jgi:hypothetical protein
MPLPKFVQGAESDRVSTTTQQKKKKKKKKIGAHKNRIFLIKKKNTRSMGRPLTRNDANRSTANIHSAGFVTDNLAGSGRAATRRGNGRSTVGG